MNTETGQIHPLEEVATMSRAERRKMVPIPAASLERVRAMAIEERKAWAADERKQRRLTRNKRKRERQARKAGRR